MPTKKPRSAAPKISPLRGMTLEKWIGLKTSGWQADMIRRMVEAVLAAVPDATVSIKWSQPVFELNGPFAFIKPAKAHLSFGFWRGAELADPLSLLECGDRMGHLKVRESDRLNTRALTALVKDAARLNREKGNPTSRR